MTTETETKVLLLVDGDIRGAYAWQHFALFNSPYDWGIQDEDIATLRAGPDDPNYWEAAANAEMGAEYKDMDGHVWHLHHDVHIYALRDDLTDVEYREAFP